MGGSDPLKKFNKSFALAIIFFVIGIFFNIGQNDDLHSILIGNKEMSSYESELKTNHVDEKKDNDKEVEGLAATIGKKEKEIKEIYGNHLELILRLMDMIGGFIIKKKITIFS